MTERERYDGFLESADLIQSAPVNLTIANVVEPNTEQAKDGRLIDKPIVSFEGTSKRMILGATNVRLLKAQLGARPKEWIGKQVTVGVRYLKSAFGQTNVPTLRVILPEGAPMPFSCFKHYGSEQPYELT